MHIWGVRGAPEKEKETIKHVIQVTGYPSWWRQMSNEVNKDPLSHTHVYPTQANNYLARCVPCHSSDI